MTRISFMQHKFEQLKNMPTRAQIGVLFVVSHKEPITIKEISHIFHMTSSAGTQLVNELVKGKFLARKEDQSDGRKTSLILTEKGKKNLEKAKEYRIKRMIEMFKPLTDNELGQLLKLQAKIVEGWEKTKKILIN